MDLFAQATALHRAGRLEDAARKYVDVLRQRPDHADALQLLGMVMSALGHPVEALDLLDRAVAASPRHAAAHANRGLLLLGAGRAEEAVQSLRKAVRLDPTLADAWSTLGAAHGAAGDAEAGA